MAIVLSPSERDGLRDRYLQAHREQGIEILGSTLAVERNGGPPIELSVDSEVVFERRDSNRPGKIIVEIGTIGLFVRVNDAVEGWQQYAVIMAEGQHGQPRQFRVNVQRIRLDNSEPSNS